MKLRVVVSSSPQILNRRSTVPTVYLTPGIIVIVITVKPPEELSADERKYFVEKVTKGREVDPTTLPRLVKRARFLAFYRNQNELVGVGGVKRPYDAYRNRIFESAKSEARPEDYEMELGWIFVERSHRGKGVGKTITCALLGEVRHDKIYAVTRMNNEPMKHLLKCNFDFHQSGEKYQSLDGKRSLVLYVRDY
jgi:predicted GNAT family N-acyltransferase